MKALTLNLFHQQELLLHSLQPLELTMLHLQILFLGLQSGPKLREFLFRSLGPLLSTLLATCGEYISQVTNQQPNKDQRRKKNITSHGGQAPLGRVMSTSPPINIGQHTLTYPE